MTHHDEPSEHEGSDDQSGNDDRGGTVSEAGSSSLNADAALGGADGVPDTPDVNDDLDGGRTDASVAGSGDEAGSSGETSVGDDDDEDEQRTPAAL
ncbi:hypothetical protein Q9R29_09165 [Rothia sp. ARF10]|nr:hypothetical protein [Rothia sp. ARF10]